MAYKYKDFNYADYVSKNQQQLNNLSNQKNSLYNQINNFDKTYDYTKDAGWIAADAQLKKDARIAGSNAVGRMGNRIGAISTSMQNASDSIYADALKNSQNLAPTYKESALNKLNNQYGLLQNQYSNLLSQEQQDYNNYLNNREFAYNKYTADKNYDYQNYLNSLPKSSTSSTSDSKTESSYGESSQGITPKTYAFSNGNISGLRSGAKDFVNGIKGKQFTESAIRQLILNNAEEYDLETNDIKNIYNYLGLDSSWVDKYKNSGLFGLGKGVKLK